MSVEGKGNGFWSLPCYPHAFLSALGQTPDTRLDGKTQDQATIKKLMEDLAVAWNKHDGVSFAMLFAEDADFTNWRGTTRLYGREEIKKMNANLAVGMFRQSTLTLTDAHVRFFAPDVAAIECDWDLVGAIDYDGKGTIPPRKYFPLFIVTREKGQVVDCGYAQFIVPIPASRSHNRPAKAIAAGGCDVRNCGFTEIFIRFLVVRLTRRAP